ncbi:MAG: hypothetical protein A2Y82_02340 [Candidatus Buchananbacteria bacterium RBG_13_36_9]|uniref:Glycosyltransferase 2-like domain-containing protein n=1 Tax=Candidatus Buchananbacteria bacterium RBG_13_36_9 TaxID=1797530 RepID=A0A1G1XP09_9BACT|nr:MAG: hypothetical protein A2Y82_02340 [Candidatus Buchananbacteria bacterium RBG_13_36_9]
MPDLSIIIPTYNRKDQLVKLIASILISDFPKENYEIIIIDDCSTDSTPEYIRKKFIDIANLSIYTKPENKRKSNSVNLGWHKAKGRFLFFIDDDTEIAPDTISQLYAASQNLGADYLFCPLMLYYDQPQKIWFAGLKLNFWATTGKFIYKNKQLADIITDKIETDAIITAFFVNKKIFDTIGGFNEKLFPFQFEELDFCVRAKTAGYKHFVITSAKLWHNHQTGNFINNPWRLYLEVKNRIISAKLWSQNRPQIIISHLFAMLIPISYLILKSSLFRDHYIACIKAVINGVYTGRTIAKNITPYYKRNFNDLKKEIC